MQDDPENNNPPETDDEHDPAAPPPHGVDWRVFVGVGIALAGFLVAILLAAFG